MVNPLRQHLASSLAIAAAGFALSGCSGEGETTDADGLGVDEIVYVVREHTARNEAGEIQINVADGMGQVMDHGRYVPGARIEVRNVATGETRNLLGERRFERADVSGLDLSFDATKVVFSMKLDGDDNYHLYVANLVSGDDADNPYGVRQLTSGTQDDLYPIWLAGGRIAFSTTRGYTEMGLRADEYNHSRQVPQVAVVTEEGGEADRKLCSQNLSNSFDLFAMSSGQVGFSRWEHLENVNDSKLFAMHPDCTQMVAVAGQHGKEGFNSLVQVVETNERNVFVAVATERENTLQAGSLVVVDARADVEARHDEEIAGYEILTPAVPKDDAPSPIGRYRTPSVLPDGRLLVSWAGGEVNEFNERDLTPPDWGIYVYDAERRENDLVFNDEDTWEIFARPVVERPEPPVLGSIQASQDATLPLELGSINIARTSLGELHGNTVSGAQFGDGTSIDDALRQAVKVRIIEGFSSEAAMGVNMFGLTMAEGAAILGEATVHADGSWLARVPPFIPYHLQPIDEFELSIRNQTTWIQGMPGEARVCGGCHERRVDANIPTAQQLPLAQGQRETFMLGIADRTEYPWALAPNSLTEVQKILTAKCESCHNETTNGSQPQEFYTLTMTDPESGAVSSYPIPRLDLSGRPIAVVYDDELAEYAASYVSLFYPSAIRMEMGMTATVQGALPPEWAIPSDARNSALIEKLNMWAAADPNRTAWPLGVAFSNPDIRGAARTLHPEDVGVTLTREERTALIRAIDIGGQYYSRQNSEFTPYESNPLGTTSTMY